MDLGRDTFFQVYVIKSKCCLGTRLTEPLSYVIFCLLVVPYCPLIGRPSYCRFIYIE